jgi:tetratricopeptide (TPR) repeat protein
VALAVAAVGGCAARSDQRRYAQSLQPARIGEGRPRHTAPPRRMRVRVYADREYRAHVRHWEGRLAQRFERFNAIVGPAFGVQLEVVETRPWERGASSQSVEAMLAELEVIDPGEDVDWVIGLVSGLTYVTSSLHELGVARALGRHIVLRNTNDAAERALYDQVFDAITAEEREALYRAIMAHKDTVILLHEWGHTLGALHTEDPASIMNPTYDPRQAEFAAANAGIVDIALRYRGPGALPAGGLWAELGQYLDHTRGDGWVRQDVAWLRQLVAGAGEVAVRAGVAGEVVRPGDELTPDARKVFARVVALVGSGEHADAWRLLEPLTEQYEEDPQVVVYGCRTAAVVKGAAYPTPQLCARALELAPDDPRPRMALAAVHIAAGERDAALRRLREADERLAGPGAGGARADATTWRDLALQYQALEAVTWCEQALARAGTGGDAAAIATWATQLRRRYGLPPDGAKFGIAPDTEPAYLALVKEVLAHTYAREYDAARDKIRRGLARYPGAPGLLTAECDLLARTGKYAAAERSCARALRGYDEAVWAHYLGGALASRSAGRRAAAIEHLERTIELDPDMRAAYEQLAKQYEAARKSSELETLKGAYQAKFGQSL